MKVELLSEDVDPIQFKPLRPADDVVSQDDAIHEANECALEYLLCKFSDLVVLVEEDGPEGLPIFDVSAVEVEGFVL